MTLISERFHEAAKGRTYCRSVGEQGLDIVVVNGGPGLSWDYLEALDGLVQRGYRLHYFDPYGAGQSDLHVSNPPTLVDLVEQLAMVTVVLTEGRPYAILAHSAGAAIALEQVIKAQSPPTALILLSAAASGEEMVRSIERRGRVLPPEAQEAITTGDTASPAYAAASGLFFQRFVCRCDPLPAAFLRSIETLGRSSLAYRALWGADTFHASGNLKEWDFRDKLRLVSMPSLVCWGRYDELDDLCAEALADGIAGSVRRPFENSSHTAHLEEPEAFLQAIAGFLAGVK